MGSQADGHDPGGTMGSQADGHDPGGTMGSQADGHDPGGRPAFSRLFGFFNCIKLSVCAVFSGRVRVGRACPPPVDRLRIWEKRPAFAFTGDIAIFKKTWWVAAKNFGSLGSYCAPTLQLYGRATEIFFAQNRSLPPILAISRGIFARNTKKGV
jgi:hypothetical protein